MTTTTVTEVVGAKLAGGPAFAAARKCVSIQDDAAPRTKLETVLGLTPLSPAAEPAYERASAELFSVARSASMSVQELIAATAVIDGTGNWERFDRIRHQVDAASLHSRIWISTSAILALAGLTLLVQNLLPMMMVGAFEH